MFEAQQQAEIKQAEKHHNALHTHNSPERRHQQKAQGRVTEQPGDQVAKIALGMRAQANNHETYGYADARAQAGEKAQDGKNEHIDGQGGGKVARGGDEHGHQQGAAPVAEKARHAGQGQGRQRDAPHFSGGDIAGPRFVKAQDRDEALNKSRLNNKHTGTDHAQIRGRQQAFEPVDIDRPGSALYLLKSRLKHRRFLHPRVA